MKKVILFLSLFIPLMSFAEEPFIIGKWKLIATAIELTEEEKKTYEPYTAYMEFFKDQSYHIETTILKPVTLKGRWEYTAPKLTIWDGDNKSKSYEVKTISKDEFEMLDQKDNLKMTFTRVKK